MSDFHLTFPISLSSVSANGCQFAIVDCASASEGAAPKECSQADDQAIGALNAIARRLHEMQSAFTSQATQLGDQVSQAATEIARAVLCDDELVQNRALQFVQIALEQIEGSLSKTAFVHPSCVATIQKWIDQSDMESLDVAGDESVAPGDCRIDCGETGVTATLDAFLESMLAQTKVHH
ncbi:MAG: FliH/SctL family protein [Pirellulaceae bacterium]